MSFRVPLPSAAGPWLRPWRSVVVVLGVLLAALPWLAAAQDQKGTAPATTATTTASAPVKPIAVADIATRADDDDAQIDRVLARTGAADDVDDLTRRLARMNDAVNALLNAYTPSRMQRLPVARLESLQRHWRFNMRQYRRWHTELGLATQPFLDDAATLARHRVEWEQTQESLRTQQLPAALSERVDGLIQRLKDAEGRLGVPLGRYLELRRQGNTLEGRIDQGNGAVEAAIRYIDGRLLRLDSPPLWAFDRLAEPSPEDPASDTLGLDIERGFAQQYRIDDDRPVLVNLAQILLLPLLLWLSFHVRRLAPDPNSAAPMRALTRPLSLWILLSALLVFVIEPDAPVLLFQVAMVVAALPVLRLLPREARARMGGMPYVITALYLLARVGVFVLGYVVLYRLFILVLGLVGMGATAWVLWRARQARQAAQGADVLAADPARGGAPGPRGEPGLRKVAWLAVLLLGVGTVLNIVGNFSLAETLVEGVVDSAFFALMLYAGVSVGGALVHWLLGEAGSHRLFQAQGRAPALATLLGRLIKFGAICAWILYTMDRLRVLRPIYGFSTRVLTATFEVGEISLSLGSVLVFVLAVVVAVWVARSVRALVHDEVLVRMHVSRGVGNSVASLTYYAVLVVGFLLALSAAGFKVSQLALVFGALGVGIGFGLQGVVNNFVSGLVLMVERPIQPGDTIDVGTVSGTVTDIGLRATTMRTFDGADVVVPNGTLLAGNLTNWTLRDRSRRIELTLGVGYGADPSQVLALLLKTAGQIKGVVLHPEPSAFFTGFGKSALEFSVRVWTFDFDNWFAIRSELATQVHRALTEAGIEIPFPQTDLHLRSVSPEAMAMFAARAREGGPAARAD